MDKLTIITPCSRPENLQQMAESINIPQDRYRWIVVHDSAYPLYMEFFHVETKYEEYYVKNEKSICGNTQRNLALDMVNDGWVYFLDDDTVIHKDLWENVKDLSNDFISFGQQWRDGKLRLKGNDINLNTVDSGNVIIHYSLLSDVRWDITRRDADGLFAHACKIKSKSYIFIPKILSTYNALR